MKTQLKQDLKKEFDDIKIESLDFDQRKNCVKIYISYSGGPEPEAMEYLLGPKEWAYADFVSAQRV